MRDHPERWAKIGITIQFAALVRILAEYFRLRTAAPDTLTAPAVDYWVGGALIAAVLCWAGVTLLFFRRFRLVVAVAALTVLVLLVYKFTLAP